MGSDARIDQLEGRNPESCVSWLRSHKGCQNVHVRILLYSIYKRGKIVN